MSVELSLIFPLLCLLENSRLNFIAMYNVLQNKWEENISTQILFKMRIVGNSNGPFIPYTSLIMINSVLVSIVPNNTLRGSNGIQPYIFNQTQQRKNKEKFNRHNCTEILIFKVYFICDYSENSW